MRKCIVFIAVLFLVLLAGRGFADEKAGILLLEHGGDQEFNEGAEELRDAVKSATGVPVELGYVCCVTWGNSGSMQYAINKLAKQGVTKVVAIPAFVHSKDNGLLSRAYNILGIGPVGTPPFNKEMTGAPLKFASVPQDMTFAVTDGWRGDELIAGILLGRVKDISKNPKEETLFILDHGATYDWEMPEYDKTLNELIEAVKSKSPYKRVAYGYWRDDADKEIKAVQKEKIRNTIAEASKDSKVLVVCAQTQDIRSMKPNGKWIKELSGLTFDFNSHGLNRHPNFALWFKKKFNEAMATGQFVKSDPSKYNQVAEVPAHSGLEGMEGGHKM